MIRSSLTIETFILSKLEGSLTLLNLNSSLSPRDTITLGCLVWWATSEVDMSNLNTQQKTCLSTALLEREQALREDLRRELDLQDDFAHLASEVPDPGDQSFANLSIDLGNAAVSRDLYELRAIDLARKKLASGSYGDCIQCGYAIPYQRLQAMPSADRCAPCQDHFERTHHEGMKGASM